MTTAIAEQTAMTEEQALHALEAFRAKHNLPEPATAHWHEHALTYRTYRNLTVETHTRDDVAKWAKALRRKVLTEHRIFEGSDRSYWIVSWEDTVQQRGWQGLSLLRVKHLENRTAKTTEQERAEQDRLLDHVFASTRRAAS